MLLGLRTPRGYIDDAMEDQSISDIWVAELILVKGCIKDSRLEDM